MRAWQLLTALLTAVLVGSPGLAQQATELKYPFGTVVQAPAFAPDGRKLAFFAYRSTAALADPDLSGVYVYGVGPQPVRLQAGFGPACLGFTPDGSHLVLAGDEGRAEVWDPAGRRRVRQLVGHAKAVRCLAVSPDGKVLATAGGGGADDGQDGEVRLWDAATGRPRGAMAASTTTAVAFSPDGTTLVTGHTDGSVVWWDVATAARRFARRFHSKPVRHVAVDPDGPTVVSVGADSTVRRWSLAAGERVGSDPAPEGYAEGSVSALTPDGRHLAYRVPGGASDPDTRYAGDLVVWDVRAGKRVVHLKGQAPAVQPDVGHLAESYMAISSDAKVLAYNRNVWDLGSYAAVPVLEGGTVLGTHRVPVVGVGFVAGGTAVTAAGGSFTADAGRAGRRGTLSAEEVALWDRSGKLLGRYEKVAEGDGLRPISALAVAPGGSTFATGSGSQLWVWDSQKKAVVGQLPSFDVNGRPAFGGSLAFAADKLFLFHDGVGERGAYLIDPTPAARRAPVQPERPVTSAEGQVGLPGAGGVFPAGARKLSAPGATLAAVAPAGDRAAFLAGDRVVLWDLAADRQVEAVPLPGRDGPAPAVMAFAPGGKVLALGVRSGGQGAVSFLDLTTGELLFRLAAPYGVNALAFSPDGRRLAAGGGADGPNGGDPGEVTVWDVPLRKAVARLRGHASPLTHLAFSPDGARLVTAGVDRTARLWDLSRFGAAPVPPAPPAAGSGARPEANSVGMGMITVPAGEFRMGSHEPADGLGRTFNVPPAEFADEHPRRRIRLTRPFAVAAHETTVDQFARFVAETYYVTDAERVGRPEAGAAPVRTWRAPNGRPAELDHPVTLVSHADALAFCRWLLTKEGKRYRLPTEAEWEYACRAGTATRFWYGDDPEGLVGTANVPDAAWWEAREREQPGVDHRPGTVAGRDGYAGTAPVGRFRPNPWGLYDVHGNVWEWCQDWYAADAYAGGDATDPTGPPTGVERVTRGGCFL